MVVVVISIISSPTCLGLHKMDHQHLLHGVDDLGYLARGRPGTCWATSAIWKWGESWQRRSQCLTGMELRGRTSFNMGKRLLQAVN